MFNYQLFVGGDLFSLFCYFVGKFSVLVLLLVVCSDVGWGGGYVQFF